MGTDMQVFVVLTLCFAVIVLSAAVLILVEDHKQQPEVRTLARPTSAGDGTLLLFPPVEDTTPIPAPWCPACNGTGVVDLSDGMGRTVVAEVPCHSCSTTAGA